MPQFYIEIGCNDGDVRLSSQVKAFDGQGLGGYLEICVNGEYASVCADNTSSSIDLSELARLGCRQLLGYSSKESL